MLTVERLGSGWSQIGLGDFDFTGGHGDDCVAGFGLDILDLAGVAIAVEGDDDERDAGGRESIEQCGLILGLQLGMQPILGRALGVPIGSHAGAGRGVESVDHDGLLKRKRPARWPGVLGMDGSA